MIPNYLAHVEDAIARWPSAWRDAHSGNANTETFIRLLASYLHHNVDIRVGLNGKRLSETDVSDDGLAILDASSPIVDVGTGQHFAFIDCIARAGAPDAAPSWQNISGTNQSQGRWIQPPRIHDNIGPPPPPQPPPVKKTYPGDGVFVRIGDVLEADYREGGQALNAGSVIWMSRVIWDHLNEGLTLDASIAKHRPEWRQALGLSH